MGHTNGICTQISFRLLERMRKFGGEAFPHLRALMSAPLLVGAASIASHSNSARVTTYCIRGARNPIPAFCPLIFSLSFSFPGTCISRFMSCHISLCLLVSMESSANSFALQSAWSLELLLFIEIICSAVQFFFRNSAALDWPAQPSPVQVPFQRPASGHSSSSQACVDSRVESSF